jgi:hypothetical protein
MLAFAVSKTLGKAHVVVMPSATKIDLSTMTPEVSAAIPKRPAGEICTADPASADLTVVDPRRREWGSLQSVNRARGSPRVTTPATHAADSA